MNNFHLNRERKQRINNMEKCVEKLSHFKYETCSLSDEFLELAEIESNKLKEMIKMEKKDCVHEWVDEHIGHGNREDICKHCGMWISVWLRSEQ